VLAADRYQGGEKPAWILEIEEARATSTGAIGQSEAWAGNPRQQQQQQQKQQEEQEQQREGHEYVQEEEQEVEEHETERVEREEERAKDEMEEKAVKDESVEEEEKVIRDEEEEVTRDELTSAAAAAAATQQVSDQPVTSQHPASDVRAVTSLQHEHAMMTSMAVAEHDVINEDMTSRGGGADVIGSEEMTAASADVTEPLHTVTGSQERASEKAVKDEWDEDGEELRRDAAAAAAHHVSDQPMTSQQPASDVRAVTSLHATTSDDVRRVDEQPHGHVMPSPVDTDAVARHQQPVAVQSSSSSGTSAGVDERGKRRHKDDKSRRPEHSAEVSRLAQS